MKPKPTRPRFYSTKPPIVRANLRQALLQFAAFGEGTARQFKLADMLRAALRKANSKKKKP
ncbi:MAG: hypothetical protein WCL08_00365 [Verrucomicrobiota bacterium]